MRLAALGDYIVSREPAHLRSLLVGQVVATALIQVYEGVDATGRLIAEIVPGTIGPIPFDEPCPSGIFVKVTGLPVKASVLYRI